MAPRRVRDLAREVAFRLSPFAERLPVEAGDAIALTFDDGPHPLYTPQVLDVLAEHRARATFFVVGARAFRHPDLVRRIADEGHAVGSHSFSHREAGTLTSLELLRDYRAGRRAVERVLRRPVLLFRPPKGHYSGRSALAMRAARLRAWSWSCDSEDWRPRITPDELLARVANVVAGDVVLLHDASELPLAPAAEDRSATIAALPRLIASARDRGLDCVSLENAPRTAP